ncbi:hypothetical protein FA13DRAFT_1715772 [Coprinellus micaceus]|uniref:Uncharacterized protein n=1 Tax=Coprinellus micaceus TaxID=71717 RepID=A0A4Y7SLT6_COPMI|nr:hypothetical protein FA13DRAFT_1715772 [Coprinellus micaceus]
MATTPEYRRREGVTRIIRASRRRQEGHVEMDVPLRVGRNPVSTKRSVEGRLARAAELYLLAPAQSVTSVDTTKSRNPSKPSNKAGIIVGAVLGSLALLITIALLFIFLLRKHKQACDEHMNRLSSHPEAMVQRRFSRTKAKWVPLDRALTFAIPPHPLDPPPTPRPAKRRSGAWTLAEQALANVKRRVSTVSRSSTVVESRTDTPLPAPVSAAPYVNSLNAVSNTASPPILSASPSISRASTSKTNGLGDSTVPMTNMEQRARKRILILPTGLSPTGLSPLHRSALHPKPSPPKPPGFPQDATQELSDKAKGKQRSNSIMPLRSAPLSGKIPAPPPPVASCALLTPLVTVVATPAEVPVPSSPIIKRRLPPPVPKIPVPPASATLHAHPALPLTSGTAAPYTPSFPIPQIPSYPSLPPTPMAAGFTVHSAPLTPRFGGAFEPPDDVPTTPTSTTVARTPSYTHDTVPPVLRTHLKRQRHIEHRIGQVKVQLRLLKRKMEGKQVDEEVGKRVVRDLEKQLSWLELHLNGEWTLGVDSAERPEEWGRYMRPR